MTRYFLAIYGLLKIKIYSGFWNRADSLQVKPNSIGTTCQTSKNLESQVIRKYKDNLKLNGDVGGQKLCKSKYKTSLILSNFYLISLLFFNFLPGIVYCLFLVYRKRFSWSLCVRMNFELYSFIKFLRVHLPPTTKSLPNKFLFYKILFINFISPFFFQWMKRSIIQYYLNSLQSIGKKYKFKNTWNKNENTQGQIEDRLQRQNTNCWKKLHSYWFNKTYQELWKV